MEVLYKVPYYRKGNERDAETCFLKKKLNSKVNSPTTTLGSKKAYFADITVTWSTSSCAMKQTAIVGEDDS